MDVTSAPAKSQLHHPLCRRNSISTSVVVAPTKLSLTDRNFPSTADDLELLSIKPASHSYSSLKDLLPPTAAVNSPEPTSALSGPDISIRNRLVKQAAQAYLRPMSAARGPPAATFSTGFGRALPPSLNFSAETLFGPPIGHFGLLGSGAPGCNGLKCAWYDCLSIDE